MLDGFSAPSNLDADLTSEDAISRVAAFDLFGCPFPLVALVRAAGGVFVCAHVSLPWWWWGIVRYAVGLSCRARAYAVWAAYATLDTTHAEALIIERELSVILWR